MVVDTQKQTHGFQTEVKQVLDLVIHSLYSNKEIFLRELISNSSDACDKLRFEALGNDALLKDDPELKITVEFDKDNKTVTIRDNGIGMSRDEVIENLGTIAKSGTREFLSALTGDKSKDNRLIGQFGVGFYSAFIVANRVVFITRRAGLDASQAVRWESEGTGEYTIENIHKASRGSEVILYLKEDELEFLDGWRLRNIITKYSDHISFPVMMVKQNFSFDEKKEEEATPKAVEYEAVNKATALWMLNKNDIKDEEYKAFYKHISHDFEDPLTWMHNRVEGKQEYTSLLYIPARAPFDLWHRDRKQGLKLYVQRVFIMDDVEQFLPSYLRFVRGIIDANDLPLNVSREILQSNRQVEAIKSALTKRVLDSLEKMIKTEPETYQKFWTEFGNVVKEGPGEDFSNKERIAKLLRFASTHVDDVKQTVSLEDYISRMKEGQEKIFYVTAESFNQAKHSPHLEIFRKKGIEVLLLSDRVDEWLVSHLMEFSGKSLQSVTKGNLDLGKLDDAEDKTKQEAAEESFENILKQIKEVLSEQVKEVRLTHRLTDSPACLVFDEDDMSGQMQRLLQSVGQNFPKTKPIFELNPEHKLIQQLKMQTDDERFKTWVNVLFNQAVLSEGGQLDDPQTFIKQLNTLLLI